MQTIHYLTYDMTRPPEILTLHAVQGDSCTRVVQLQLLQNDQPWEVPAGVTAAVAFRKLDKHRGLYDRLPDGTKAVTIDGSTVTAVLAPQVLTCGGEVRAAVVFYDGALNQLATFPLTIQVEENPAAGQAVSNDYYRYSTMEAVSKAVEGAMASLEESKQDFLDKAEEALAVVHDTATADAPAIVCDASGSVVAVSDAAERPLQGLTLYGKTVQNGTPTPETPVALESVGESGTIKTTLAGKNLIPYPYYQTTQTTNGITFTDNGDGSITATGTATAQANFVLWLGNIKLNTPAYLSGCPASNGYWSIYPKVDGIYNGSNYDYSYGKILAAGSVISEVGIQISSGTVCNNIVFYPQLAIGNTRTDFTMGVLHQTITASTPNGLPGIPVESGGNYTDENGQAWLCDEIDFARGKYVQRVIRNRLLSSGYWQSASGRYWLTDGKFTGISESAFCTHYARAESWNSHNNHEDSFVIYLDPSWTTGRISIKDSSIASLEDWKQFLDNNEVYVLHELATPVETPLSAEELAAFAALHGNYPNTTVFNDSGAGMKLNYVADTKTYIDQKIAAISAAMLNA